MDIKLPLPKVMLEYIQSKVDCGDYNSASAVIEGALVLLEQSDVHPDIENLRQAWQEGRDSGDFAPLDVDAIKREGRARLPKRA